ncbi:methyltransferase domain-containing protein [Acidobacteria bacterium AB60]|nr:methyltransferase domain-containing protein [Acidobacteria bacterium AB60]
MARSPIAAITSSPSTSSPTSGRSSSRPACSSTPTSTSPAASTGFAPASTTPPPARSAPWRSPSAPCIPCKPQHNSRRRNAASLPAATWLGDPAPRYHEGVPNPWLAISLEDYEGHMSSEGVRQTPALSQLFRRALDRFRPASVAVLGIAGGNGLEHIDSAATKRVVGVDINQKYLDQVHRRFPQLPGLESHCHDLAHDVLSIPQVDLVYAALIFEHAGLGRALDNALALVEPSGTLAVVLQLPSDTAQAVAATSYASMQDLKRDFALIDVDGLVRLLAEKGFPLVDNTRQELPAGKAFWYGAFTRR